MNKENMAVLTNVIGAVESGGQIYGKRDYSAYAAPYTNSNVEHTITLGWAQNYGSEAHKLIQMIYDADPAAFKKIVDDSDREQYFELFVRLMRLSYVRKVKEMKKWSEEVAGMGRERQKHFLSYCQYMVRENFIYNFHNSKLNYMSDDESDFAVKFAPFINENNVIGIMNELNLCERDITQNGNAKIVFFDFALKMIVLIKNR